MHFSRGKWCTLAPTIGAVEGPVAIFKLRRFSLAIFLLCVWSVGAWTQSALVQQEKKRSATPDWKPAILPADALAYGSALHQQAPPQIKAWCEEFAHKDMPRRRIDPREIMGVVDKQFPNNSDEARDAAIYLVFYLSYLAEDNNQRELAHEIRQNDYQREEILRQIETIDKNNEKRLGNNRLARTPQQVAQEQEDIQKMEQQLRALNETWARKMKELATSRKRVDGYLKVLDVTHKRMNGIEPSILREFQ